MASKAEFIEAAKKGDATMISSLLQADPGVVRAAGDYQKTALYWAGEMDRAEVAAALVEAGAEINFT